MRLPAWGEFTFEASRSRGPGGQSVNRTSSAALLRWPVAQTRSFTENEVRLLLQKLGSQLTTEGELLIRSEVHKSLEDNRRECLRRLSDKIEKALRPVKKRVATKPTRSSVHKRLTTKKLLSDKKKSRKTQWDD